MDNNFKIYCLCDPRTNEIRYIGQTRQKLIVRLQRHISKAKTEQNQFNHRVCWIKSILERNERPIIQLIEEGLSQQEAIAREIYYIQKFRSEGIDLVNTSDGGEYHTTTDETKKTLSEKLRVFDIPKDELYDLYVVQNKTRKEVADFYGCSEALIMIRSRRFNIKKKRIYHIDKDDLYQLYIVEKKSIITIASMFNMSDTTIWRLITKYQIPIQPYKMTEEGKQHLSRLAMNRVMTDETKNKIRQSLTGKPKPKKYWYKPLLTREELIILCNQYSQRQISQITNINLGKIRYMFKYYQITTNKKQVTS